MKKAIFLAAAVLFVASSVSAVGYIGIYADAAHSINSVCPAPGGIFTAWIWCLPSVNGLQAAEFAVGTGGAAYIIGQTKNPAITVELGSFATGISIAFGEGTCNRDWVWVYQMTCLYASVPQSKIEIIPHPMTLPAPAYQFASCLPGYPIEPCTNLTPLYLCGPGPVGVQETNWGAIKSLF
jgi:hypothetical protein